MNKTFLAVLVIFACFAAVAHAWADVGHILTAEIARRNLTPEHVSKLDAIAGTFNPYFNGHDVTKLPYLATFMDLIKSDTHLFDSMHFIDYPYQIGGDFEAPNPESINGIMAMTEAANTLIFKKDDKSPGVWGKAFSLMLLVHVLGDIHQPLHAVALFSEEFTPPTGDMGGNKWQIEYTSDAPDKKQYTQMHLLFDCIGGVWSCDYMPALVNKDFEATIARYTESVMAEYPIEMFKDQLRFNFTTDTEFTDIVTVFAREAFELAKVAYDSYPLRGKIDEQGIQWARSILRKQIALGGYRMARILERIDTRIVDSPDRNSIPAWWRVVCIFSILIAFAALVGMVLSYRKYKDYKQLSPQGQSLNGKNSSDGDEYQSLIGQ